MTPDQTHEGFYKVGDRVPPKRGRLLCDDRDVEIAEAARAQALGDEFNRLGRSAGGYLTLDKVCVLCPHDGAKFLIDAGMVGALKVAVNPDTSVDRGPEDVSRAALRDGPEPGSPETTEVEFGPRFRPFFNYGIYEWELVDALREFDRLEANTENGEGDA